MSIKSPPPIPGLPAIPGASSDLEPQPTTVGSRSPALPPKPLPPVPGPGVPQPAIPAFTNAMLPIASVLSDPQPSAAPRANPLGAMMGVHKPNPLDAFFVRLDSLPEGTYRALIVEWTLGNDRWANLKWAMLFRLLDGELAGMEYEDRSKVTAQSFHRLKKGIGIVSNEVITDPDYLYDVANDCAGPVRSRVVGAIVRVQVSHRDGNNRTFVNVDIVKLLQPAPGGTDRNTIS